MPDAHPPRRRHHRAGERRHPDRRAARLVRLIDHRVIELATAELAGRAGDCVRASTFQPDSLVDPDWWSALGAQLRANPGVAQRMTLEITETTAIQNIDETAGFVSRAKDLGCRIAIDDFGAGYTSFRNLRRLGVDMIKIDGAFVQTCHARRMIAPSCARWSISAARSG
jgi:EAL domain-containing protein (putative c-di-GMP-specific phosphodiesterase class I)